MFYACIKKKTVRLSGGNLPMPIIPGGGGPAIIGGPGRGGIPGVIT